MHILIAEDDPVSRRLLESSLVSWGYQVLTASNGIEAWHMLQRSSEPSMAILDWMMPHMDGLEVCRKIRATPHLKHMYILLLTAKSLREHVVAGLQAGADDYVTKPFDRAELRARVQVGARIVILQRQLTNRIRELEEALSQVKQLQGLLPICSYCKKIRDDQNYWQQVEEYISKHSRAQFSHSICPDCYLHHIKPKLDKLKNRER